MDNGDGGPTVFVRVGADGNIRFSRYMDDRPVDAFQMTPDAALALSLELSRAAAMGRERQERNNRSLGMIQESLL